MKLFSLPRTIVARRHGGVFLFVGLFLSVSLVTRCALLLESRRAVDWNTSLAQAFAWGALFDVGAALLFAAPLALGLTLLPARFFERRWARALAHGFFVAAIAGLLFGAVAEWTFWDEFSTRFNFIAVDYLVYTTEVIGNIRESYPMPAILGGIAVASVGLHLLLAKTGLLDDWLHATHEGAPRRYAAGGAWLGAALLAGVALDSTLLPGFSNNYNRELAKNGQWSLFAAFWDNELNYDQFYPTIEGDRAFALLRSSFGAAGDAPLTPPDEHDTLRYVQNAGPERRLNVIQITVESLSARYLGVFEPKSSLTPNLDAIAAKSLLFTRLYATGTRTDRGMEALTLSIPPTPGRSLVKRANNTGLFTLGSVFRSRGYDTAFIYGGYGYFDNMNTFFGGNGYRIVDRAAVKDEDVTFANAWGACDEDTYAWTLREADAAHAEGRPFHYFVMTTSNHRPYTFPDGRIDLPSKTSGRRGAVRYTDYAIGKLLRDASTKPWFKDTVFVIVADHCASSAGRAEIPVQNYHIPLLIYAPGGQVAPGRVEELTSQIDVPPTLLGLLGWSYATRFYGQDVLRPDGQRRALLGTHQKLGLFRDNLLQVLKPGRGAVTYACDPTTFALSERAPDESLRDEAVAYYETASELYKSGRYRAIGAEEQAAHAKLLTGPRPLSRGNSTR